MRQRRETVEHPFGTMKARMGATHFLTKTLPKVAAEVALSVLAYNLTRVMNIVGIRPLTPRSWPKTPPGLGYRADIPKAVLTRPRPKPDVLDLNQSASSAPLFDEFVSAFSPEPITGTELSIEAKG
jgi:transposase